MSKHHREWIDQFSAYLSGELDGTERARVEEHVAGCSACREILAQLSEVLTLAAEATLLEPPRDLWPGVAASIGRGVPETAGETGAGVIALPTAHGRTVRSLQAPTGARLAAAAVLLVAISAGTTWWITSGAMLGVTPVAPEASAPGTVGPASNEHQPAEGLADQLRLLEEFLASARETLDPGTVLVLERNLNAIETAIGDSRDALALDPGNDFLIEHLERMYQRKLLYLQDAVRVAEWAS